MFNLVVHLTCHDDRYHLPPNGRSTPLVVGGIFFALLCSDFIEQTRLAALCPIPLLGGEIPATAQISQGSADGGFGQLQLTGDGGDRRLTFHVCLPCLIWLHNLINSCVANDNAGYGHIFVMILGAKIPSIHLIFKYENFTKNAHPPWTSIFKIITTGRAGGLHQPPWGMSIG